MTVNSAASNAWSLPEGGRWIRPARLHSPTSRSDPAPDAGRNHTDSRPGAHNQSQILCRRRREGARHGVPRRRPRAGPFKRPGLRCDTHLASRPTNHRYLPKRSSTHHLLFRPRRNGNTMSDDIADDVLEYEWVAAFLIVLARLVYDGPKLVDQPLTVDASMALQALSLAARIGELAEVPPVGVAELGERVASMGIASVEEGTDHDTTACCSGRRRTSRVYPAFAKRPVVLLQGSVRQRSTSGPAKP